MLRNVQRASLTILAVAATGALLVSWLQADPPRIDPLPSVLIDRNPGVQMRAKLDRSKQILEGLIREDYYTISRAARELERICTATDWPREDDVDFENHRANFSALCKAMDRSATARDPYAIKFQFLNLTQACLHCHEHVRDNGGQAERRADGDVRLLPR